MAQCIQCGKQLRLSEQMLGFIWKQHCLSCRREQQKQLDKIQIAFDNLMATGSFSQEEWNNLIEMGTQKHLSIQDENAVFLVVGV